VLDHQGRVLARVQQRAEAIWPAGAGGSTRAVTEPIDEEVERAALSLLRKLGWFGLAQVQFIETAAGKRFLIDVNPRFYGSLGLAIAAGADLPAVWAEQALGRTPGSLRTARPGVRYHAVHGDLKRVVSGSGVLRGLSGCVCYSMRSTPSVWRVNDPRPAAVYPIQRLRRALRSRAKVS
jgi:predicted ATP-grasp superfamily ATP-dependent carboligase